MQNYLEQVKNELRLRNYSPKTIKSYLHCLADYFNFLGNDFEKVDIDKIKAFLLKKQRIWLYSPVKRKKLNWALLAICYQSMMIL